MYVQTHTQTHALTGVLICTNMDTAPLPNKDAILQPVHTASYLVTAGCHVIMCTHAPPTHTLTPSYTHNLVQWRPLTLMCTHLHSHPPAHTTQLGIRTRYHMHTPTRDPWPTRSHSPSPHHIKPTIGVPNVGNRGKEALEDSNSQPGVPPNKGHPSCGCYRSAVVDKECMSELTMAEVVRQRDKC